MVVFYAINVRKVKYTRSKIMDWLDFFFGMYIGAEICEAEYEEELRNRYYNDFDEDAFEQYLFERKLINRIQH